jgi:uncharacterized membrane protein YbhN (UPF0104 family)
MPRPTAVTDRNAQTSRLERAGDFASRLGSLDARDPIMRRGLHIAIAVLVLLGVVLAIWGALNEFPNVDWRWRPVGLALGIIGTAAFLLLNAELWRRLLHALGPELHPLPASTIWFVSGLGRFVPTSLLTPMIRTAMAEREGVPKRICLVSVIYEIALALSGALVVAAYFIVNLPDLEGEWARFLAIGLPVIALIVLQPGIFHRLTVRALERLGRPGIPQALGPGRIIEFLGQSIYPMGADDIVTVLGAFAVGTTIGIIAFVVPAGLVAREAGLAVALSPIMPTAPAVAIAVLARIVQIATEALLATLTQIEVRRRGYPELDTAPEG